MANHRNIRILTWFNFFTDFRLLAPVAILYFANIAGSYALGLSIFSITMVASSVFQVPTGLFSDRIGRRSTVIWGALAAVIYSVLYALGHSYWILALGAVFEGISRSFYSGNDTAMLHETLAEIGEEASYGEVLGKVSSMFQIALATSAVLGGILAHWSFGLIVWLSVIPQIICLILAFRFSNGTKPSHERKVSTYRHLRSAASSYVKDIPLRNLTLASILEGGTGEAVYQLQSAFYSSLVPIWAIGAIKAFNNLLGFVSFQISGSVIKKLGHYRTIVLGTIYNHLATVVAVLFPTLASPFIISSTSLTFGPNSVAQGTLMQQRYTDEQRATMSSLSALVGSLFFGIASYALGSLADRTSPAVAILWFQVVIVPAIWLYSRYSRGISRD